MLVTNILKLERKVDGRVDRVWDKMLCISNPTEFDKVPGSIHCIFSTFRAQFLHLAFRLLVVMAIQPTR